MTTLRHRGRTTIEPDISPHDPEEKPRDSARQRNCSSRGLVFAVLLTIATVLLVRLLTNQRSQQLPLLRSSTTAPDDEAAISSGALPLEDHIPHGFSEEVLTCMPSVTRRDGAVEYVSNAVKSFRLATNGSTSLRRLVVFDMDAPRKSAPAKWLPRVFAGWRMGKTLPSWLAVAAREREVRAARKQTLGDSGERVQWRSKEAQDYGEVLSRCAALAERGGAHYVLVAQDDVLFRGCVARVAQWCDQWLVDRVVQEGGKQRVARVCGASLFDLPGVRTGVDGHALDASNMVARVWEVERAKAMARYFGENYDEAPVDWLADRVCKHGRRRTVVMEPNCVRHRGGVSSFVGNDRQGLLT